MNKKQIKVGVKNVKNLGIGRGFYSSSHELEIEFKDKISVQDFEELGSTKKPIFSCSVFYGPSLNKVVGKAGVTTSEMQMFLHLERDDIRQFFLEGIVTEMIINSITIDGVTSQFINILKVSVNKENEEAVKHRIKTVSLKIKFLKDILGETEKDASVAEGRNLWWIKKSIDKYKKDINSLEDLLKEYQEILKGEINNENKTSGRNRL